MGSAIVAVHEDTTQSGGHASHGPLGSLSACYRGGSRHISLAPPMRLVIGRAPEADLTIDDATVSRRHIEIAVTHAGLEVLDLGSHNGTFVRGRKLARRERVRLSPGDPIELGDAMLIWHGSECELPSEAPSTRADVHAIADRVAVGTLPVLITGETGVGKEILAARIHARSPRARAAFVRLNCAALPEALLEAELFGHEPGAFTGASRAKPGLIESAHGGTLLLDELGDLPLGVQAKLLRVLEAREVTRLGSLRPRVIDVRFIASTNRDLSAMIRAHQFRADLYYRLNGITLHLAPLRERRSEIAGLAREFARTTSQQLGSAPARLGPDALLSLEAHAWPGNVRELRNVIECATLVCSDGVIRAADLRLDTPADHRPVTLGRDIEDLERSRIRDALERCHGNQTRAAVLLGIPRQRLIARIAQFGLPRPRKRQREG